MRVPNINCKHYDGYGFCKIKPRKFFSFFKPECVEVKFNLCDIADRFPKPIFLGEIDKESIKKVYNKLMSLSQEEFEERIKKHKDSFITKLLMETKALEKNKDENY